MDNSQNIKIALLLPKGSTSSKLERVITEANPLHSLLSVKT